MIDNEFLAKRAASFRQQSKKEFDKAVDALIALAFKYKGMGADFLWEKDPELNFEANQILRDLSDSLAEKAKAIARGVVEDSLDYYDFDEAWDRDGGDGYIPILTSFDQQGSFLKELLEIWIALSFVNGIRSGELRVLISRYMSNPFASPLWRGLPADILKWGRGFSKNIADQIAVIGQNAIIAAVRYAEWVDAQAQGAEYYIRRRGSGYDCPECDSLCGYPISIEIPFEFLHSRCMCFPEFYFEPMPL